MPNLQSWIRRITDSEMPIFGRTVQEVVSVSENDDSSVAQLGQVILKDAAMTSRVLKLANSSYYNPGRQRFSTISRAIMMLGFDTVRSMCLTVVLIDSLVQGVHREHLIREMARSLHAAAQAQQIARLRRDSNPEEVFISTLLLHIGDLAFWCFAKDEGAQLDAVLQSNGKTKEQAQREVLGFALSDLSVGLAREWSLSELLQDCLQNPQSLEPRNRCMVLAHQLALASEAGWDSEAVRRITADMAKLAGCSEADMTSKVQETARQAVETTAYYGAGSVAREIPLPPQFQDDVTQDDTVTIDAFPQPDTCLQLQVLRELTGLMDGQGDFNTVVEMILEGIHRGIGMDRTLFALLSPDRRELRPKFVLGDADNQLRKAFTVPMDSAVAMPVRHVLSSENALWSDHNSTAAIKRLISDDFRSAIGTEAIYLAPIVLRGKSIGVFYADRMPSGRPLDAESFDSFRHFGQQGNLVINHLANRRGAQSRG